MEIFIHIGPPKTGTSAIQEWCSSHRQWLLLKGVHYPAHQVDKNYISSGNLMSLFDMGKNGQLALSQAKLQSLMNETRRLNTNKLLLSSEFFFDYIDDILEMIPNARLIVYLRNELEVIESSHNQSVKRHSKTDPFVDILHPISTSLRKILRSFQKYSKNRFILRFYSSELFVGRNIVQDFLDALGLNTMALVVQHKRINSSYSHIALEFKRRLNSYKDPEFHRALDEYLQFISDENSNYSLLSKRGFEHAKRGYLAQIEEFINAFPQPNGKAFIDICAKATQAKPVLQILSVNDAEKLFSDWLKYDTTSHNLIQKYHCAISSENISKNNEAIRLALKRVIKKENFMLVRKILSKFFKHKPQLNKQLGSLETPTTSQLSKMTKINESYPNVAIISHHIPKTAGSSFGSALINAYGRDAIFGLYKSSGANSMSSGEKIQLPTDVNILHGHFASHVNHLTMFPNARRICWVRDPAERLWSLTKHILRNKQPIAHYNTIMKYADNTDVSTLKAFELILLKPEFSTVRSDYQRYFAAVKPHQFDFVGSIHRYDDELVRLESTLGIKLERVVVNTSPDSESLVNSNPVIFAKAKSILREEYALIEQYI